MLATPEQLTKYLRTGGTVSAGASIDAELIALLLESASSRIAEARPERTLEPWPATDDDDPVEVRVPIGAGRRIVQVPDLRNVESVVAVPADGTGSTGTPIAATGFVLRRRPREVCALWLKLATAPLVCDGELVITGRFGPAGAKTTDESLAVRPDVREACLVWAARAYHNRTARYADTVQDPGGGVASYFRNLPPDVKSVVDSLEVPGI